MIFIYKCEICGKEFEKNFGLSNHYNRKHSDNIIKESIECKNPNCNNPIERKYMIYKGEKIYFGRNKSTTYCSLKCMQEFNPMQKYEQDLNCPICGKNIANSSLLERHLRRCKERKCEVCGEKFYNAAEFYEHERTHKKQIRKKVGEGSHKCTVCGKDIPHIEYDDGSFEPSKITCSLKCAVKQSSITREINKEGIEKFKCPACKYEYDSEDKLRNHFDTIHKKEDCKFECPECKAQFKTIMTYKTHIKKYHADKFIEKEFVCKNSDCNNVFKIKYFHDIQMEKSSGYCSSFCCRSEVSKHSTEKFWKSEQGKKLKEKRAGGFNGVK